MPRLEPITQGLPVGFEELRAEARAAGYRHLDRLAEEWASGNFPFDREGEVLLAAYCDGALVGVGGLTIDPVEPDAFRLRRFYDAVAARGQGIGRALAEKLLERPRELGSRVTVNAAAGSEAFWERLGFVPDSRDGHSHLLAVGSLAGEILAIGRRFASLPDQDTRTADEILDYDARGRSS